MMSSGSTFRTGLVALVGRPNVGKSTLLNALLGEKIAIVSSKPQTTRTRIRGILNRPAAQMVFIDTPGISQSKSPLHRMMRRLGNHSATDADVVVVVVELRGDTPRVAPEDLELVEAARRGSGKLVVAINKVDRIANKQDLLPWIQCYAEGLGVDVVVPISAQRQSGLDALLDRVEEFLPPGEALFPLDATTDLSERFLCEELIREQLLLQTHQEIPHSAAVVIESFEDGREENGLCRLEGRIYLERDSQKGIVVGKGGARIKSISTQARHEIGLLLGAKVYLRLTVHVVKDWTTSEAGLRRFGLDGEL
ncbi:MAG: GTPase Era [Myxococcota bacterium]